MSQVARPLALQIGTPGRQMEAARNCTWCSFLPLHEAKVLQL